MPRPTRTAGSFLRAADGASSVLRAFIGKSPPAGGYCRMEMAGETEVISELLVSTLSLSPRQPDGTAGRFDAACRSNREQFLLRRCQPARWCAEGPRQCFRVVDRQNGDGARGGSGSRGGHGGDGGAGAGGPTVALFSCGTAVVDAAPETSTFTIGVGGEAGDGADAGRGVAMAWIERADCD